MPHRGDGLLAVRTLYRRISVVPAAVVALLSLTSPISADPPAVGAMAIFRGDHNRVLACDTLGEIMQIFHAEDRRTAFLDFNRSLNANGFRACELINTSGYVLAVIPLGVVAADRTLTFAWGLQLGTEQPGYSFWVLHLEPLLMA
jgi:hypothetical protein